MIKDVIGDDNVDYYKKNPSATDEQDRDLLMVYIICCCSPGKKADPKVVNMLVASGFDVNSIDASAKNALIHAAQAGADFEVFEALLKAKANVKQEDADQETALTRYLMNDTRDPEVIKLLLKNGSDTEQLKPTTYQLISTEIDFVKNERASELEHRKE